jgi:hypothetical protein
MRKRAFFRIALLRAFLMSPRRRTPYVKNMTTHKRNSLLLLAIIILLPLLTTACAKRGAVPRPYQRPVPPKAVPHMAYTVQAGAFSDVENAARLTESLC